MGIRLVALKPSPPLQLESFFRGMENHQAAPEGGVFHHHDRESRRHGHLERRSAWSGGGDVYDCAGESNDGKRAIHIINKCVLYLYHKIGPANLPSASTY